MTLEFDLSGRHLVIGVPCYDGRVHLEWALGLAHLGTYLNTHGITWEAVYIKGSSIIDKARTHIAQKFLDNPKATDLAFIDTDLAWEYNDLLRLMAWASDKEIVVAAYPTKTDPPRIDFTMFSDENGSMVQEPETKLLKARYGPLGFSVIRRTVFEQMENAYPELQFTELKEDNEFTGRKMTHFFQMGVDDGGYFGEDISFCRRWEKLGGYIWIDPHIALGHIGSKTYKKSLAEYMLEKYANPEKADEVEALLAAHREQYKDKFY